MKRKFLIAAAACAAGVLCVGGVTSSLADFSGYAAENGETNVAEWFSIENGASVKVDSQTRGMRFATYVSKEKFDELETQGKNPVFGTLFMPESDLAGEKLTLETENAANVTAEKWVNNRVAPDENGNYMYMSALINLPEEYYSSNVCARSYVTIDGETSYTETVSRSYSGVALAAYADTSANFGAEMKNTLYNSYLNGKKFAGLDANSISYDAKNTSLTVSDGGKINVSEKGKDRAWNNVFFKYDQKFEKGKTYYFSFELKNVVSENCDLYLGVRGTEDGRKLTINGFTTDTYKKVSEGDAITFTYTAEDNFDYMRFFLFSNFDTAGGAYSYSYSVDNFAVECTDTEADYVPNNAYSVKLSNATGDNPVSDWTKFSRETSVLTENAVGTVTAAKIKGWQGVYLDFGTLKAGSYKLQLKVHNLSGEAVYLYTRQFKDDVQSELKDFGLVNDSTTQTLSQNLTFDKDTSYKVRIFSANNGSKANVKFEIGGLLLERTSIDNPGTLGGMFTVIEGYNGTTLNREFSENNSMSEKFARVSCGEGSETSWRGISMRLYRSALKAGTYTIKFSVYNCDDKELKLYSSVEGQKNDNITVIISRAVTEHGSLGVGGQKTYSVSVQTTNDVDADSFIQLAVFSMTDVGHTFEIGDVSVDFTAAEA